MESALALRERIADREELRGKRVMGRGVMPWPPCPYAVDDDWDEQLHRRIGAAWPCPEREEFWGLWRQVLADLETRAGLTLGRGAFAGWGDGEPGLVRAAWCLTRHLRPQRIVETGVARGISSRFLLEAMERNGDGRLWSIDLPPPLDRELHRQIGIAVPAPLRTRWTYLHGSSRRRLPRLLRALAPIDLFIHDSNHTARNLMFELEHAWAALDATGAALADDIDLNCGWHRFAAGRADQATLICPAEPLRPDPIRQDGRGVFGIALRGYRLRGPHPGTTG